jgi:hypothetical protein
MIKTLQTMVGATEKIFLTTDTIFLVNQQMVSGFATMDVVSHTMLSEMQTMIEASPTMVGDHN